MIARAPRSGPSPEGHGRAPGRPGASSRPAASTATTIPASSGACFRQALRRGRCRSRPVRAAAAGSSRYPARPPPGWAPTAARGQGRRRATKTPADRARMPPAGRERDGRRDRCMARVRRRRRQQPAAPRRLPERQASPDHHAPVRAGRHADADQPGRRQGALAVSSVAEAPVGSGGDRQPGRDLDTRLASGQPAPPAAGRPPRELPRRKLGRRKLGRRKLSRRCYRQPARPACQAGQPGRQHQALSQRGRRQHAQAAGRDPDARESRPPGAGRIGDGQAAEHDQVGSGAASAHATVSAALTSAAPAGARLGPSAAQAVSTRVRASSAATVSQ